MTRALDKAGWEHKGGYYLNADGKRIAYERTDGREISVECMVSPDAGMEYVVGVFDADGRLIDGLTIFQEKDNALDVVTDYMKDNQLEAEP